MKLGRDKSMQYVVVGSSGMHYPSHNTLRAAKKEMRKEKLSQGIKVKVFAGNTLLSEYWIKKRKTYRGE